MPVGLHAMSTQGCFCPDTCTGMHNQGCTNVRPAVRVHHWVEVITLLDRDNGTDSRYLAATRDIPAGTLFTVMGGVTVQQLTHKTAYDSYTALHKQQHDDDLAPKFQYSVQAGSEAINGSLSWFIPTDEFGLLHTVIESSAAERLSLFPEATALVSSYIANLHAELKALTAEDKACEGIGQYVQHTHCNTHRNAHLFPIFILREDAEGGQMLTQDGEWWELKGVALRSEKLILKGDEILINYVEKGRTGNFSKVFDCTCCKCTRRCP